MNCQDEVKEALVEAKEALVETKKVLVETKKVLVETKRYIARALRSLADCQPEDTQEPRRCDTCKTWGVWPRDNQWGTCSGNGQRKQTRTHWSEGCEAWTEKPAEKPAEEQASHE